MPCAILAGAMKGDMAWSRIGQEAVNEYEQGAQCGDLQSMNNLACCSRGSAKRGTERRKGAFTGIAAVPKAATAVPGYNLGRCYNMGHGVEQNWQEAVNGNEQGAQCGHLQSMNNLAYVASAAKAWNRTKKGRFTGTGGELRQEVITACTAFGWNYSNGEGTWNKI